MQVTFENGGDSSLWVFEVWGEGFDSFFWMISVISAKPIGFTST